MTARPIFADSNGSWVLTGGRGSAGPIPLVDGAPITLVLAEGTLDGVAACNHYGGTYNLSPRWIVFGGASQNLMGCADEVIASEEAFTSALFATQGMAVAGDQLVLTGPEVELRFEPVA